jgi:integrase
MPRPRPPRLQREITRHGRSVWYVRRGHGTRIRIRAEFGTSEFEAEYRAALDGAPVQVVSNKAGVGTLEWLWDRYRETTAWSQLALGTRRKREYIMVPVLSQSGKVSAAAITKAHIMTGRDRRKDTPAQARHFLDTMRGLFSWATDAGHIKTNPTDGIKKPAMPKDGGYAAWTEDDVARYEARWPIGTKERVWLGVLLYTGLRRGDAVLLGPQHIRDGVATLLTEKTKTRVTFPILPVLDGILQAGPSGDLAFICGAKGQPLVKDSFGTYFRDACNAAGVNKSAHGVRKIGAIRAAHNGATVAELDAIFGWTGGKMAALYTEEADRARLAKGAMSKLGGTAGEQIIPAPTVEVRDSDQKTQRYQSRKKLVGVYRAPRIGVRRLRGCGWVFAE